MHTHLLPNKLKTIETLPTTLKQPIEIESGSTNSVLTLNEEYTPDEVYKKWNIQGYAIFKGKWDKPNHPADDVYIINPNFERSDKPEIFNFSRLKIPNSCFIVNFPLKNEDTIIVPNEVKTYLIRGYFAKIQSNHSNNLIKPGAITYVGPKIAFSSLLPMAELRKSLPNQKKMGRVRIPKDVKLQNTNGDKKRAADSDLQTEKDVQSHLTTQKKRSSTESKINDSSKRQKIMSLINKQELTELYNQLKEFFNNYRQHIEIITNTHSSNTNIILKSICQKWLEVQSMFEKYLREDLKQQDIINAMDEARKLLNEIDYHLKFSERTHSRSRDSNDTIEKTSIEKQFQNVLQKLKGQLEKIKNWSSISLLIKADNPKETKKETTSRSELLSPMEIDEIVNNVTLNQSTYDPKKGNVDTQLKHDDENDETFDMEEEDDSDKVETINPKLSRDHFDLGDDSSSSVLFPKKSKKKTKKTQPPKDLLGETNAAIQELFIKQNINSSF